MKKLLIVTLVIAFLFTACGSKNNVDNPGKNTIKENATEESASTEPTKIGEDNEESSKNKEENAEEQTGGIEVDKSLLTVKVTYPALLVGENKNEILNSKGDGIKEVIENEDGSITLVMTKSKYNEMMEEAKKYTIEFLDSIASSGDYPSIKKVTYNDDFSDIILEVDKEAYENSFDGFALLIIGVNVGLYKVFDTGADFKISVKVKDINTGEIFSEAIFPDDFNNM